MPSLPTTMQALLQTAKSTMDISVGEHPVPSLIPGHVLIRVHAAAINPIDFKRVPIVEDTYPYVYGYDVAGVIADVAEDVTNWKEGDRVFGDIMRNSVGVKQEGIGTVAEYCLAPADLLAAIPDNVSYVGAAAMPVAAETGVAAFERMGLKEGETVFVSGGAGGVGVHAMQIAHALGASKVFTTASAAKTNFVKEYGADVVVDYRTEDAGEVLKGSVDVVMDCVGDVETANKVAKGDRVVTIVDYTAEKQFLMLEPSGKLIGEVAKLLESGKLKPVIDSVFKLDEAVEAVKKQTGGRAKGKIVVQVIE